MSWYKNVLIENVIEKYLASAEPEVLATRNRLIEERAKVVEKSKSELAAQPGHHHHRHRHVFSLDGANPLLEFFGSGDRINYHDLSFNEMASDVGSSNEDEEDMMEEEIHFLDEYEDEDFSEEEDEDIEQIILEEDQ